jgi:sugar transferase (PEP-CTERM/EpsH1 system associated)
VIHALGVGGLENGLVNLINRMPAERYRHAIVCMTGYTDFHKRIERRDVEIVAMHRGSVPLWRTYIGLVSVFRRLAPAIVHSRNLSGLDALIPAWIAGVKVRIHGEHGRDADDLDGLNPRNLQLRRLFRPLVRQYCAVSQDLQRYIVQTVGVPAARITQIYNGVDTELFLPEFTQSQLEPASADESAMVVGTVGRLQPVKDHVTLIKAFAHAKQSSPGDMRGARLVIVGEGPCRDQIAAEIARHGIEPSVSMLGERQDVANVLRTFDVFALPSLVEGISNTILEAMASGLPVLATRAGGNPELVAENETGQLVSPGDWQTMATWLIEYARNAPLRRRQGRAARKLAGDRFSMTAMVQSYLELYDRLLLDGRNDRTAAVFARPGGHPQRISD